MNSQNEVKEESTQKSQSQEENNDDNVIDLGGVIKLKGFNDLGNGQMVVVKKMVGNYVRKIENKNDDFDQIELDLEEGEDDYTITAELIITTEDDQSITITEDNVFIGVDAVMKKLIQKA